MANLTGWQAVAREIGDWDWNGDMLIPQCNHSATVGDWLPAEAAAKEILRLRERVKVLEAFVAKVADKHQECEDGYYSCPKAWNAFGHGRPDECWCQCEPARAALTAAERQQETDR